MKKITLLSISILMISMLIIGPASAATCSLNLPDQKVSLTTVFSGPESFFISTLSGVPSGYDVENKGYLGWCVDLSHIDLPASPLTVKLIPSCNIPAEFNGEIWATESWDMVNYILNNKPEVVNDIIDIQMAIWYFVDNMAGHWNHPWRNPSAKALEIIADAEANGGGFVPSEGDIVAIICVPDEEEQLTIIELRILGMEGLTPGFWKNQVDLWEGYNPNDKFSVVFGVSITIDLDKKSENDNPTLLEALKAKGGIDEDAGIYDALARHAVAALLNAAHGDVDYHMIEATIKAEVKEAIENTDMYDAEPLKNMLESYNTLGGGIDAHGNPI